MSELSDNDSIRKPGEPESGVDRLSAAFESSARRWELIVYPSLFAFIILAAYGFYLVYSLAKDMHYMAISVDSHMTVLAGNMQSVSENMGQMTANIRTMTVSLDAIDRKVGTLEPMLANIGSMDQAIQSMTLPADDRSAGLPFGTWPQSPHYTQRASTACRRCRC